MDKQTAIDLAKSNWWEKKYPEAVALAQLEEPLLCMPWEIFHKTVEEVLKRPVYTHEFADPELLIKEIRGQRLPPTIEELLEQLPKDKTIMVAISGEEVA